MRIFSWDSSPLFSLGTGNLTSLMPFLGKDLHIYVNICGVPSSYFEILLISFMMCSFSILYWGTDILSTFKPVASEYHERRSKNNRSWETSLVISKDFFPHIFPIYIHRYYNHELKCSQKIYRQYSFVFWKSQSFTYGYIQRMGKNTIMIIT